MNPGADYNPTGALARRVWNDGIIYCFLDALSRSANDEAGRMLKLSSELDRPSCRSRSTISSCDQYRFWRARPGDRYVVPQISAIYSRRARRQTNRILPDMNCLNGIGGVHGTLSPICVFGFNLGIE